MTARALFTPSGEAQRILRAAFLRFATKPLTRPLMKRLMGDRQLKMVDIAAP